MRDEAESDAEQEGLGRAQAVKRTHEAALLSRANVVGVGVGLVKRGGVPTGDVGIIVMVSHKRPRSQLAASDIIPRELEGVPVDVQEVGELGAQ